MDRNVHCLHMQTTAQLIRFETPMIKNLKIPSILKLLPVFVVATSIHASITVGAIDPNAASCYPFSCGAFDGLTRYQQVYSASEFGAAPLMITSITIFLESGGPVDSADYSLFLSTTSRSVTTLSSDLGSNVEGPNTFFANVHVGLTVPALLTFTGTPFLYNPSQGNLLLDVLVSSPLALDDYYSYFQADSTTTVTARAWSSADGDFGPEDGGGLVTEFGTAAAVPEPGTYGMLAIGSLALLASKKRK